jgi:hypothetical protein
MNCLNTNRLSNAPIFETTSQKCKSQKERFDHNLRLRRSLRSVGICFYVYSIAFSAQKILVIPDEVETKKYSKEN